MGVFVTPAGFVRLTYEDHKNYYEAEFKRIFGESIDLDPTGAFGQMVALFALRDTNIWDGAEEIYNSRNPNSATGISLDNIASETGVVRQPAGKTFASNVYLFGDLGTTIEAGRIAREAGNDINYILVETVEISLNTARYTELTIGSPSDGDVFTIVLDGITYSFTAGITDTAETVAEGLLLLIQAGIFTGDVSRDGDVLIVARTESNFIVTFTPNISLELIATGGDFEAEVVGANPLPVSALDTIVTPVTGWNSVINTAAGITGRLKETDEELRIRRASTLLTGNATDEALRNRILNSVDGVSSVSILSNREDTTSLDGLPPHSFEMVIIGGSDSDIGINIWRTQPSGIQSFGTEEVLVTDSQGTEQKVYFSRPTAKYIWVKVQRGFYSEEEYPSNGDNQIKDAIVDWALRNLPVGKDVIRQRLNIPIYTVPGIGDVNILIDSTASPSGTPTYAEQDISVLIREFASFDQSRIIVEALP